MRSIGWARSVVVLLAAFVSLQGCVFVPFVQAFKETGLTESDRMALLPQQVKKFSDARVFGNKIEALSVVAPDARNEIGKQLNTSGTEERIIKSKIEEVEWVDSAYKARVVVKVESFTMSSLIVGTTTEEQQWEFSTGSGWQLTHREKVS